MNYKISSLQQILDTFQGEELLGATEISEKIGKSRVIVHKYLHELVIRNKLKKIGTAPQTKYQKVSIDGRAHDVNTEENTLSYVPDFKQRNILDAIFLKFSPDGKIMEGFSGLGEWCVSRNLDIKEKAKNYQSIYEHIESLQDDCGLLNAGKAFGKDFENVYLDQVYYADQYKRMEFGRGKLAELTFYGKQSQNKYLIAKSIDMIFPKLECLIAGEKFDAIAITPWSIDRKNQLLKILKSKLQIFSLPFVNIVKYYPNKIAIPQKSLKTRQQRIQNARNTIFVDDREVQNYKKVLLIDDFVGSGSTLNETAAKLKQEGVETVYGFAFVGNLNLDYEVINEI